MNKAKYENAVVEIYLIDNYDVITTSGGFDDLDGGNAVKEPDFVGGGLFE